MRIWKIVLHDRDKLIMSRIEFQIYGDRENRDIYIQCIITGINVELQVIEHVRGMATIMLKINLHTLGKNMTGFISLIC
ncbi:hypothetical protein WN48_00639 [Eufriesea mexicana]|uniref:Uncharacterized protein n=1 Tax=Eufriesea mexicana TaxID=516756 RepID=A0A310SEF6_9HYME|nr:hypothetical protein WN48_00639 [Eufriesea mexicana]